MAPARVPPRRGGVPARREEAAPMAEDHKPAATGDVASLTDEQKKGSAGVAVIVGSEASAPFKLNPAYLALGVPLSAFKHEVGGKAPA
jgi:hypothetical protein